MLDERYTNPDLIKLDRVLFLQIRNLLPSNGSINFIRSHDYGGSFYLTKHSDLAIFEGHLELPEFEFFDQELEELRQDLTMYIKEFQRIIARKHFPLEQPVCNVFPDCMNLKLEGFTSSSAGRKTL